MRKLQTATLDNPALALKAPALTAPIIPSQWKMANTCLVLVFEESSSCKAILPALKLFSAVYICQCGYTASTRLRSRFKNVLAVAAAGSPAELKDVITFQARHEALGLVVNVADVHALIHMVQQEVAPNAENTKQQNLAATPAPEEGAVTLAAKANWKAMPATARQSQGRCFSGRANPQPTGFEIRRIKENPANHARYHKIAPAGYGVGEGEVG